MPNQKLHTAAFCKFFHLVLTFSLPPFNNFQLSLPSFCKSLPNPREVIATLQLVLKSLIVFYVLDLLYYTPVKTAATNEAIAAAILEFVVKAMDNENEHLRRHTVCLMDDLKLL